MRDHVICLDGPLTGRRFVVDETPPALLGFEAVLDDKRRVLAVNRERLPVARELVSVVLVYERVRADDGEFSRDDEGCAVLRYHATTDSPP